MTGIAGIIASFAASHIGGMLLSEAGGWIKDAYQRRQQRLREQARDDALNWMQQHAPPGDSQPSTLNPQL